MYIYVGQGPQRFSTHGFLRKGFFIMNSSILQHMAAILTRLRPSVLTTLYRLCKLMRSTCAMFTILKFCINNAEHWNTIVLSFIKCIPYSINFRGSNILRFDQIQLKNNFSTFSWSSTRPVKPCPLNYQCTLY